MVECGQCNTSFERGTGRGYMCTHEMCVGRWRVGWYE